MQNEAVLCGLMVSTTFGSQWKLGVSLLMRVFDVIKYLQPGFLTTVFALGLTLLFDICSNYFTF